jgi:hypothetical protein
MTRPGMAKTAIAGFSRKTGVVPDALENWFFTWIFQ